MSKRITGWNVYMKEQLHIFMENLNKTGEKKNNRYKMKKIGAQWRALGDEEKSLYMVRAKNLCDDKNDDTDTENDTEDKIDEDEDKTDEDEDTTDENEDEDEDNVEKKSGKKKLVIHFNSSVQHLVYYQYTRREEMMTGIREILGLRVKTPLRFRDENGDTVIISSFMPNNTELHAAVEQGLSLPMTVVDTPDQSMCVWKMCLGGEISEHGHRFVAGGNSPSHAANWQAFTGVFNTRNCGSGLHYMTINFASRPCCARIGVVTDTLVSFPVAVSGSVDITNLARVITLQGVGGGVDTANQCRVSADPNILRAKIGFLINLTNKKVTIGLHDEIDQLKCVTLTDIPIPFKVCIHSSKHGIMAEIADSGTDCPPCFLMSMRNEATYFK